MAIGTPTMANTRQLKPLAQRRHGSVRILGQFPVGVLQPVGLFADLALPAGRNRPTPAASRLGPPISCSSRSICTCWLAIRSGSMLSGTFDCAGLGVRIAAIDRPTGSRARTCR